MSSSDYDSFNPAPAYGLNGPIYSSQGKRFTPDALVIKLNKERLPWDTEYTYNIIQTKGWRWDTDTVSEWGGAYTLLRDDTGIALLTSSYVEGQLKESFDGFIPTDECTWKELRFICQITGWGQPNI